MYIVHIVECVSVRIINYNPNNIGCDDDDDDLH